MTNDVLLNDSLSALSLRGDARSSWLDDRTKSLIPGSNGTTGQLDKRQLSSPLMTGKPYQHPTVSDSEETGDDRHPVMTTLVMTGQLVVT